MKREKQYEMFGESPLVVDICTSRDVWHSAWYRHGSRLWVFKEEKRLRAGKVWRTSGVQEKCVSNRLAFGVLLAVIGSKIVFYVLFVLFLPEYCG